MSELAGLGRLLEHDNRNRNFMLPKKTVPASVRRRHWFAAEVLDQGGTPQCVGYAGWGWLRGGPTINRPPFAPTDLYHWAQDLDQWPGREYDGTSILGLMRALREKTYITEYRWAFDAETLITWILTTGPVLVGTWWTYDMFMPHDKTGFIGFTGDKVGGHAWRITGADRDRPCPDGTHGAIRMVNSWGRGWGQNGRAWVTFSDLQHLIEDDGEAVTAPEIKL